MRMRKVSWRVSSCYNRSCVLSYRAPAQRMLLEILGFFGLCALVWVSLLPIVVQYSPLETADSRTAPGTPTTSRQSSRSLDKCECTFFDVLLTVHLSIFILVINQLVAQNLFYNKFISCLYMFRAPCAHHQEVKIVLYNMWYHHTCRWPVGAQSSLNLCTGRPPIGVMIPQAVWYNFDLLTTNTWCSKHVEAWNKLIVKQHFVHQVG